ncbi:hypothetical protein TrLO_g4751 [Triparma laevis f. longispina]|uniref:Uncharacterized protein n=1 Tax=Triparma laevis f. longispina TaxID=1714387 RepID=A0A9W7KRJ8_9STRA|nr:hypothetical protein TrLO_g4751 [Triparma laevis f. longispina]
MLLLSSVSAFVVPPHSAHSFRLFSERKEKEGKRKKAMDFLKKKGLIRKLVDDGRNVGVDEGPGGVSRGDNMKKRDEQQRKEAAEKKSD